MYPSSSLQQCIATWDSTGVSHSPPNKRSTQDPPPQISAQRNQILYTDYQQRLTAVDNMTTAMTQLFKATPPRFQLHTGGALYNNYVLPTVLYALHICCRTLRDLTVGPAVKDTATGIHHPCLQKIARSRCSGVPSFCLKPATGSLPLWTLSLKQQAQYLSCILSMHPHNDLRSALRAATYSENGDPHRNACITIAVHTLADMIPGDGTFQHIHHDLRNSTESPHVYATVKHV